MKTFRTGLVLFAVLFAMGCNPAFDRIEIIDASVQNDPIELRAIITKLESERATERAEMAQMEDELERVVSQCVTAGVNIEGPWEPVPDPVTAVPVNVAM
jgi:Skp family chaperone for outer membrane proteins